MVVLANLFWVVMAVMIYTSYTRFLPPYLFKIEVEINISQFFNYFKHTLLLLPVSMCNIRKGETFLIYV